MTFENLYQELSEKGYSEYQNHDFTKKEYQVFYENYLKFIAEFYSNTPLQYFLDLTSSKFMKLNVAKTYGNAPIGFLYHANHKKKKDFFHFSTEYYEFLKQDYLTELGEYHSLHILLKDMDIIDKYMRKKFIQHIDDLQSQLPDIKNIMYNKEDRLSIITKIVHYNKNDSDYLSSPHNDFSGLTLLLDNSDDNDQCFKISKYKEVYYDRDFSNIIRKFNDHTDISSCILLPGIALSLKGIKLNPSPHLVAPSKIDRFAILGFALVPYQEISKDLIRIKIESPQTGSNRS